MLFPERNKQKNITDGKFRECPNCGEPLANYVFTRASREASRTIRGYICTECDMVCVNRQMLNDLVEKFVK